MIVKNESRTLARCLDSLKDLMDEIIIVDTGSTDGTKEIAARYTSKIYDYEWHDDFAAARNFAFSKASCDYIYSADADEVIDEKNQVRFLQLKEALIPEVEIVQMVYVTKQQNHPTENFERDLRPKLFKRLRGFTWIEPVHETVNLEPIVYDSDIEILHFPQGNHSGRDFLVFEKLAREKGEMSDRLLGMYVRELYKAGDTEALCRSRAFLEAALEGRREKENTLLCRQIIAVLMKLYRQLDEPVQLLKLGLREEITVPSAEVCLELGYFFMEKGEHGEAAEWFYRAAHSCESELDIASSGKSAYAALSECLAKMGDCDKAREYSRLAAEWQPQESGV